MKKVKITQKDINLFNIERKGAGDFVIIEGMHAFKHAARFGASFDSVYICDKEKTLETASGFLEVKEFNLLKSVSREISREEFEKLAPNALRTGIVARAKKPEYKKIENKNGFVVTLEDPRDLNNVGAVIRACAARGVDALVLLASESSPWHANALRGSAGLHFAQPIISLKSFEDLEKTFIDREIIAVSDEGGNVYDTKINPSSVLIFGSERSGVKKQTKEKSHKIVGIPMQKGVSSLNLATAVSAFLFANKPINL